MNKKNKFALIIASIILIIVISVPVCIIFGVFDKTIPANKDSYDRNIDVLNETVKTDVVLYGEDIPFRETLQYRIVDKIENDTLNTQKPHQVVILSDLDGTLNISEKELLTIKGKLDQNKLDFYYLGTKLKDHLKELDFYDFESPSDDYCISLVFSEGRRQNWLYVWGEKDVKATHDNRETLGMLLVNQFVHVLEENN